MRPAGARNDGLALNDGHFTAGRAAGPTARLVARQARRAESMCDEAGGVGRARGKSEMNLDRLSNLHPFSKQKNAGRGA